MENPVLPSSCVTPAGTSIEVQNEWEENTHTHTHTHTHRLGMNPVGDIFLDESVKQPFFLFVSHLRPNRMYVCMVITYSRVWINRVRLPILLVISCTGEIDIPLSLCVPENLVSRDGFSRPVPRQPAHHLSILRLNLVLTYGIPPEFRGGVQL